MFRLTSKIMMSAICVLAAAPSSAAITAANIAGRWEGQSYAREGGGKLTLDVVACGQGWCGIKVEAGDKCAGTALKIDGGTPEGTSLSFKGTLQLASGTEPYVVEAGLYAPDETTPLTLHILGDTGGEFRAYRRSFPFEVHMVRVRDAVCHAPQNVSSLN
jgi:hypothetical protein